MSIKPHCGPSSGGTLVTIIGTGFSDTSKQSVRFTLKKYSMEVGCTYDQNNEAFFCKTPNFDNQIEEVIDWPQECKVEVTMDGKHYYQCEKSFLLFCKVF